MVIQRSFDPAWVEKYRPSKLSETILPAKVKAEFQAQLDAKNILNATAAGLPGIGKTTVFRALLDELEADYLFINSSLKGNIDTLRTDIQSYASGVSLSGGRKYVLLDEADNMTQATQLGLRSFMERYSATTGFLLTCNHPHKLDDAILSRCPIIDFRIAKDEKPKLAMEYFKRACFVLEQEGVKYDKNVLVEVIKLCFPDFRLALNWLQRSVTPDGIGGSIIDKIKAADIGTLIKEMKDKNYTNVRKWVGENYDMDTNIYRKLYNKASDIVTPESVPVLVLLIADYEYKAAFVADREINLAAFCANVMLNVVFK
jgi:DNA polymerase III delta prime subunit